MKIEITTVLAVAYIGCYNRKVATTEKCYPWYLFYRTHDHFMYKHITHSHNSFLLSSGNLS